MRILNFQSLVGLCTIISNGPPNCHLPGYIKTPVGSSWKIDPWASPVGTGLGLPTVFNEEV